jgi:myo-inositol-hexaphosphate 3-phosphohydrolase
VVDRTNRLIKAFQLDGTFVQDFGAGLFHTDVEDVDVYRCGADGYILVSDQDADRFEIFDRVTLQPLARFRISGVADTDGLAIVRHPLPGYPYGAIFVQSDNRNVHGLGWERLAAATGMATCLP